MNAQQSPEKDVEVLEKLLRRYLENLQNEGESKLNCEHELLSGIMDLVYAAYTNDTKKISELSNLIQKISFFLDQRRVEQQEIHFNLHAEIHRLQKKLGDSVDSDPTVSVKNIDNSIFFENFIDNRQHEQIVELKLTVQALQDAIEQQEKQIKQIINAVDSKEKAASVISSTSHFTHALDNAAISTDRNNSLNSSGINSLVGEQSNTSSIEQTGKENEGSRKIDACQTKFPAYESEINKDRIVYQRKPKHCSECGNEFPLEATDLEIYNHVENCLYPSGISYGLKHS